MPNNCQGCIISDMSAACKPDDSMCHLFHRRLAGLLTGKPDCTNLKGGTIMDSVNDDKPTCTAPVEACDKCTREDCPYPPHSKPITEERD